MRPMITDAGAGGGRLMEKQSLVPAVQELWNAWEIPCLMVTSLFLQVFLFLFASMRRRSSWWCLRTVLWLAYLSADSVAVFVLGHLAVRATEPGHQLMSLWAPFVLVHLGGQDTITAFSKQDSELWLRHLLNLVTQAAVAVYVLGKASWPDGRLKAAVALMFLCGCLKYAERTFCLFLSDPALLNEMVGKNGLSLKLKGMPRMEAGQVALIFKGMLTEGTREEAIKHMRSTLDMMSRGSSGPLREQYWVAQSTLVTDIISVDAPINQAHDITIAADDLPCMLEEFLYREDRHSSYERVGALLEHCYRRLYTKDHVRQSLITALFSDEFALVDKISPGILWLLCAFFPCASTSIALALFMAAEKGGQLHAISRVDIIVSYSLLVGAIVLDVLSAAIFIYSHLSSYLPSGILYLVNCVQPKCCKKQWSQELKQYNMINSAGKGFIWRWFSCDVTRIHVANDHTSIKQFILDTLLVSGTRKQWNIASTRGQLALHRWMDNRQKEHPADSAGKTFKLLEETVRSGVDFPTSVLIWHIATDMCYYCGGTDSDQVEKNHLHRKKVKKHMQMRRELSNYIMYLVFKCGVMLTTNSRLVHDNTEDEIAKTLSQLRHVNLCDEIVGILQQFRQVNRGDEKDDVMKLYEEMKKQQDSKDESQIEHEESMEIIQADSTDEIQIDHEDTPNNDVSADEIQIEHEDTANNIKSADSHLKNLQQSSQALKSPVLPRAYAVAQELIGIKDEAERWELIAAVWAEMLYYTAVRCGGGFHYEHLSTGGEFVTHVLALMYYLGPFMPPTFQ